MHTPRNRTARHVLAVAATAALLGVPVAATASDTTVTFEVEAASGALSVSQAGGTATLAADGGGVLGFSAGDAGTVVGDLPETTVTDGRGDLLGVWAVQVAADGPFTHTTDPSETIPQANGRVFLDVADATAVGGLLGGMVVSSGAFQGTGGDLSAPYTLIEGTTALTGSVTYVPRIEVQVPAGTPVGTYQAVITQTVS